MPNVYFTASFGNVALLISEISTARGRDIAIQSPSLGDAHGLSDRGKKLRTANCQILFCDQPGQAPYLDRYDAFCSLVDAGDPQVFSHPLDGSYLARAGELQVDASSDSLCVKLSCTFLRVDEPQNVRAPAAGTSSSAGVEAVGVAADDVDGELDDIGETSDAPALCKTTVTEWSEADDLDPQDVLLGAATLTQGIDAMISDLDLLGSLERWEAYRAAILLRYAVVRAAEAFTADADAIFEIFVETARPLRVICAELVGPADSDELATKVRKTNNIRQPGRIEAGTTLKVPLRRSAA